MKVLHLTLTKKWFDLIASGEKLAEYRELKPYWIRRLTGFYTIEALTDYIFSNDFNYDLKDRKEYTVIKFRNGYSRTAPTITVEYKDLTVGYGKAKWGAPNSNVFILELGKIISG